MKHLLKVLTLSLLVALIIIGFKSCVLDKPTTEQRVEFEKNFARVEIGMTKKQVKSLLGETSFRLHNEKGKSMEEISIWIYDSYRSSLTPIVYFDPKTNRVSESDLSDEDNVCGNIDIKDTLLAQELCRIYF